MIYLLTSIYDTSHFTIVKFVPYFTYGSTYLTRWICELQDICTIRGLNHVPEVNQNRTSPNPCNPPCGWPSDLRQFTESKDRFDRAELGGKGTSARVEAMKSSRWPWEWDLSTKSEHCWARKWQNRLTVCSACGNGLKSMSEKKVTTRLRPTNRNLSVKRDKYKILLRVQKEFTILIISENSDYLYTKERR